MNLKPFSKLLSLLVSSLLLFGCSPKTTKVNLIVVVDLTSSVEAEAQAEAFDALILTFHEIQRGDSVSIIPITGDATTQGPGRILRFELSEEREIYNGDIRRFKEQVQAKLQELREAAAAKPYTSSDILGAAQLASEELKQFEDQSSKNLVVFLTDFIQDDPQFNFKRDDRLASHESAVQLAGKLASSRAQQFENATVYVGLLRSKDLRNLPQTRRAAVNAFWLEYFKQSGANSVVSAIDGSGRLSRFLKEQRRAVDVAKANGTLAMLDRDDGVH
jgi:hypothetical protein